MDAARWLAVEGLLQAALDRPPAERDAFLDGACGDDETRRRVQALLRREAEGAALSGAALVTMMRPAPALIGRKIGRYRITARIGAGGMGEIYEARDEDLQRTVALKVLPEDFTADPGRVRRFEQEALAASRLNHPNIITIFEILHVDGAHFIAAERIEGQTLRDILREKGKLPVGEALRIAAQIAAALQAAHTAWILHRDIKPENVMVRPDGLLKVLDFGIAKLNEEPAADETSPSTASLPSPYPDATLPGSILGTARYMSPEQARGEPLDGRTDLFSLGVVLHEMVTGARPGGGTPVPREMQRIVAKLLEPERDRRTSSAAELLDALRLLERRRASRSSRRMIRIGAVAFLAAVALTAIGARLSVNETWDERVLRDGHTAAARQVIFSPDGRLLLSCGEDGRVIIWDFERRQRLRTLEAPSQKIAFAPNGRWFATGGSDGAVRIWDAARLVEVTTLRGHESEIGGLAVSPDSTMLAASSYDHIDGRTILWDTKSWRRLHEWDFGGFGTFVFSPEARQLVFSKAFAIFDLSERPQPPLYTQRDTENWLALSPDGRRVAGVDHLGILSFYQLAARGMLSRRQLVARRRAHQDHGRSIAFSPDGRLVASAAEDILLWDAQTQTKIARFEYSSIVWSLAFSPDGRWLVSSHGDGAVLIWDVAERERVASLNEHSRAVRSVAFSRDGRIVASAGEDRSVMVWDASSGHTRVVLQGHGTRVTSVAFARAADVLASADMDGRVILWDLATGKPGTVISAPPATPELCVTLSPDGTRIATSTGIYAADGRVLVDFLPQRHAQVYGAAFLPDGRRVATVTEGGWICIWDSDTRRLLASQRIARTSQIAVSASPDGRWLATGEDQGAVRLWSVVPLQQVAVLGRHSARVKSVAFSPDGETIASAADDKVIALWDVGSRSLRARVGTHASPVYSVAFSPDGRQLVSGEHDRSVRLYTRRRSLWRFSLE